MGTVRMFFKTVWRSAIDTTFYREAEKKSFRQAVGHLYALLAVLWFLTLVPVVIGLALASAQVQDFLGRTAEDARVWYPEKLVVMIEDGQARTNVKEPYVLDFPASWELEPTEEFPFEHLVTIDTKASPEDFPEYASVFLLTKKSIVFPDNDVSYRIQSLSETGDMEINREAYAEALETVVPYLAFVRPALIGALFFLFFFGPFILGAFQLVGLLLVLLMGAATLWLLLIFQRRALGFAVIYRLSLYGAVVPLAYGLVESVAGFHLPYVRSMLFLLWMAYALRHVAPPAKQRT